ncbi:MAG: tetratricopeptide repeat protein [Nitrospirae bacterium]|nr:tetratricopeptide repeat protein [Nitrospirota bacterium]
MTLEKPVELNDRGAELYEQNKFGDALLYFEKAIALSPEYGKAWCNRANCLFSLERYQEAVNSCRRAVDVSPLFPEAWLSKATSEVTLGLSEDAVVSFQIFLALADQQKHKPLMQTATQSLRELSAKGFRMKDAEIFLWLVKGCRAVSEQRQLDKAIKFFDNAISLFPQCAAAWHFKALCLRELNRPDEAIECWEKAGAADDRNAVYWFNMGVLLAKQSSFDAALASYTRATELDPYYMEAWNNRGRVLGMLRRVEEALPCFDKAIELSPSSAVTWFNKARLEDADGRREEAAVSYSRFVEHALDFPDEYEQQLTHAGKRLDELMPAIPLTADGAATHADKEIAGRGGAPAAGQISGEAVIWSDKAYDCLVAGDLDGAIKNAEKALSLDDRDDLAWVNKGAALYSRSWIGHEAFKFDKHMMNEALSCFNKAIEINPRGPLGFLNKGLCLNDLGQYPEAIASFEKTLALDPRNVTAWCHKGNSYRAAGLCNEAVYCCDRALELDSSFSLPWYFRAVSLLSLNKETEALGCFRKFLEREPDKNSVLARDATERVAAIVRRIMDQSGSDNG